MINYYLLTKPGIILGNLITLMAGFILGSRGPINFWLFFITLIGLGLVIASACVCNNYIDRNVDKLMMRTRNRPLSKGTVSNRSAILFALVLGITGISFLFFYTNILTVILSLIGFFVYVLIYSLCKCKTVYATAIGSIAGSIPIVVGYCSASNTFDLGASLLFSMMVLWQMPHFFSIAIYRLKDYTNASIPVLPVKKGMLRTKLHMVIYIVGFIVAASLLTLYEYAGAYTLIAATILGLAWLLFCFRGFKSSNDQIWARKMFVLSLLVVMGVSIASCF